MYFNIDTKLYGNQIDLDKAMYFNIGTKLQQINYLTHTCFRSMYFNIGQKIKFVQFNKKGNINNV